MRKLIHDGATGCARAREPEGGIPAVNVNSEMFGAILQSIKDQRTGLYTKELRTLLQPFSSADLPRMKDVLCGVNPALMVTRAELDLPEDVCPQCFMSESYCQCLTFGKAMGNLVIEALLVCRMSAADARAKGFLSCIRQGRGLRVLNNVVHQKQSWTNMYETATSVGRFRQIEGIDVDEHANSGRILVKI